MGRGEQGVLRKEEKRERGGARRLVCCGACMASRGEVGVGDELGVGGGGGGGGGEKGGRWWDGGEESSRDAFQFLWPKRGRRGGLLALVAMPWQEGGAAAR